MSKRVKVDINGNLKVLVLPSELKMLDECEELKWDFLCYIRSIGDKDKELIQYYEHNYHGTKFQSLFSRNVGDY